MTSFVPLLIHTFLLFQAAFAAVTTGRASIKRYTIVTPPTEDPFYTAPTGYEAQKPGVILRSRSVDALGIQGVIPIQVEVTTIIVPYNANNAQLLSYQTAEDAPWANCAPSYTLQLGSDPINAGSSGAETLLIIAALNNGWIVKVPDYEGINAVYTSGIQAGQATLDSIRAALSSKNITGISPTATYQMMGYSGGSIASEWAAELQPSYAPELNFAGVALGGLVPNISTVLNTINKGPFAGLAAAGVMGLTSGYPDLKSYLYSEIFPSKLPMLEKVLSQCLYEDAGDFAFQDIYSFFKSGATALQNHIVQIVLNETGTMGLHGTPQMPVFVYKAIADELTPIADTDALVTKFCSQGARIQYVRDALGEHITEAITGAPDAFEFLMHG